jgi:hypothetical protein
MVMLCRTAGGYELPLHIILYYKMIPYNKMFLKDVILCAQENGWMTADLVEDRAKYVWERFYVTHQVCLSKVPLIDMFEELKVKPERRNCDLVVIIGGITRCFN